MQKFTSHTGSYLPRVLALTWPQHPCGERSQQKRSWRNSVWHSVQISLTIDAKERLRK